MAKIRKDFCPVCGKGLFRRDLASFDPACESGGRNETCEICGTDFWIPADDSQPMQQLGPADMIIYDLPSDFVTLWEE